jgi:hypothetical protein
VTPIIRPLISLKINCGSAYLLQSIFLRNRQFWIRGGGAAIIICYGFVVVFCRCGHSCIGLLSALCQLPCNFFIVARARCRKLRSPFLPALLESPTACVAAWRNWWRGHWGNVLKVSQPQAYATSDARAGCSFLSVGGESPV